ncbi:hypothetical protein F383_24873 [Gossypium arboreum]|uniref:Uncharacterized protein n=2 Tax=Gossypium arboreum TaxID=29729 RepID=A0A0B0P1D6_GOSAR|nr:hypothetical protein F383_24873 [Gossypium arboreum]
MYITGNGMYLGCQKWSFCNVIVNVVINGNG